MDEQEMKARTKAFALRIIKLANKLPESSVGRTIGNQLLRAGTAVGANYRAACRGRSKSEFAAKLGNVEEEADESAYWLELLIEADLMPAKLLAPLLDEANQLTAIIVASRKTLAGLNNPRP